jgi:hypothetical protein
MSTRGLLDDTNSARTANGVSPLTLNAKLDASAQAKANDMAAKDYWSHNTPSGDPPWVFIDAQGYAYQKLGENLATGFNSEQATIDGWMASPPHRENLLDSAFAEVGFGYANITDYTAVGGGPMTIIVAHYGKPLVASDQTPTPTTQLLPSTPASTPSTTQSTSTPTQASTPDSSSQSTQDKKAAPSQLNTTNTSAVDSSSKATKAGITLSLRTSRAQTVFADMPLVNMATGLSSFIMFSALGLWFSKHLFVLRRALVLGETFMIRHPVFDVLLLSLSALGFVLSQTAGFIQ